jgi:hypothetical protein
MKERFVAFSAEVTGFQPFELYGTGLTDDYLAAVIQVVGERSLGELLDAYAKITGDQGKLRTSLLQREIFGQEKLGPIARNIIKLWYIGIWEPLPQYWIERYGPLDTNTGFMVNESAYTEGLLWVAIGANPPGAKAPGYGSWAHPPQIPAF